MVFLIDMGHTLRGLGTGASSIMSETQKNREIGKELLYILRSQGHTAIDCTVDVSNNDLYDRVSLANRYKADMFVSIHLNAGGGRGTETYIYNGSYPGKDSNKLIAKRVNDKVASSCNFVNRGLKEANFYVLKNTIAPAMLIEVCFVDSQEDTDKLNIKAVAKAIADGLTNTSSSTSQPTPPPQPQPTKQYLNLKPHNPTWAVYNENGPYTLPYAIGRLAPAQFNGLSYEILASKGNDVYIIQTQSFGKVAIWAPKDNDSSFTTYPVY